MSFQFQLGLRVQLAASGEAGMVLARSESLNANPQYLVRYRNGMGTLVEQWWGEDALQDADGNFWQAHERRVFVEHADLSEKREALSVFMTTERFRSLPEDEQGRLCAQHNHMAAYLGVLGERIRAFTIATHPAS